MRLAAHGDDVEAAIMAGVAAEVATGNILDRVERFLKAGVMEGWSFHTGRPDPCRLVRQVKEVCG